MDRLQKENEIIITMEDKDQPINGLTFANEEFEEWFTGLEQKKITIDFALLNEIAYETVGAIVLLWKVTQIKKQKLYLKNIPTNSGLDFAFHRMGLKTVLNIDVEDTI